MTAWDFNAVPFEWAAYIPPKSRGFGHGARVRGVARGWEATKAFLSEQKDVSAPDSIELRCAAPGVYMPSELSHERKAMAVQEFGAPTRDDPINGAHWSLRENQLEAVMAFEASAPKSEKGRLDPSSLHFAYRFRWHGVLGSGIGTLAVSNLMVWARGQKMFFQPFFKFAAALSSDEFRQEFPAIEQAAPFRFNDNYFKRWAITPKRGNAGRYLKAPSGWRRSWTHT